MLGGYGAIYADPPWSYDVKGGRGAADKHYTTMSLDQIKALPVADLAAPDCALFMWGVYPMLREALEVIEAWGFEYKSIGFQWLKLNKVSPTPFFGLGRWTRGNTEPCFIATRGKPVRVSAGVSQLIIEPEILHSPIGRHSAKPSEARDKIVQLVGDVPAIELFAREPAPGWDCWGNEVTSTVELS